MHLRGVLGLALVLLVAWLCSRHRRGIRWRTVLAALVVQWGFAALVLRWTPGRDALKWVADQVAKLINYTHEGSDFVFGPLMQVGGKTATIFALQVLPVIIFLGSLIGLLRVTRIESFYASTVIFGFGSLADSR